MSRWVLGLAWAGALFHLGAGLLAPELFFFNVGQSLLYVLLLWLVRRELKTSLLYGIALGLMWSLMHLGLTRWVITSGFGLWFNWRVALDTDPSSPLALALVLVNASLALDCGAFYWKKTDHRWADLKIFLGWLVLLIVYFAMLFWFFQPFWLRGLVAIL